MPKIRRYLVGIKGTIHTSAFCLPNLHITVSTYCLCNVGFTRLTINTAHSMPSPASVQYALMKMDWRAGIFGNAGDVETIPKGKGKGSDATVVNTWARDEQVR